MHIFSYLHPKSFLLRCLIKNNQNIQAILATIEHKYQRGKYLSINEDCAPWIDDISETEYRLIKQMHNIFYKDWYIADPLGCSQVASIQWEDIKKHIYFK